MKGVRFYEEFKNKRQRVSTGTVVAIFPENICPDYSIECVVGVLDYPNSPVAGSAVSRDYLRNNCRRISEARARQIHPQLFEALDRLD